LLRLLINNKELNIRSNRLILFIDVILVGIVIFAVFSYYSDSAVQSNKKGLGADLKFLGTIARQYYKRPVNVFGGGNSFIGWTIPARFDTTQNGSYKATVSSQGIRIVGIGKVSRRGIPVKQTAIVLPDAITIVEDN
jgi:hypothetical protein